MVRYTLYIHIQHTVLCVVLCVKLIGDCCVVLQACDLAIEDSSERVIDMMVKLLKELTSAIVVTPDQLEKVSTAAD